MSGELALVGKVVAAISGVTTAVLTTWMTVVAFVGGTMPIIGWQTDGALLTGTIWLLVVDPIVASACWLLTTVVLLPILALGAANSEGLMRPHDASGDPHSQVHNGERR